MEPNLKFKVLRSIGKVFEESRESKLADNIFDKLQNELNELSDYFKVTKIQAFFLAHIFALNYQGDSVDISDLGKHFNCNPMKILEYSDEIADLNKKGIIKKSKSSHRIQIAMTNDQFIIDENIAKAVIANQPIKDKWNKNQEVDIKLIDILEKLYQIGLMRSEEKIETIELFSEISVIIMKNINFPFFASLEEWDCCYSDKYLFVYLCWKFFNREEEVELQKAANGIFDSITDKLTFVKTFITKTNYLCKKDWIEVIPARFFNDTQLKITDKGLDLLLGDEKEIFCCNENNKDIVKPIDIKEKQLLYNQSEKEHLEDLFDLLQNDKLNKLQLRLTEKGLPKGITVLLYGSPGTGKTETVYQIAKKTNRDIVYVDISQSKSMWFGESEKIIKRVFDNYRKLTKKAKTCPILLFNEADAIISTRKNIDFSSVAQTENTIQNIILEELEKFEGILFATTNLVNNFDKAFERRFLYKMGFHKPNLTNRVKIWQLKLYGLSDKDALKLAEEFDFSGGQIDNIARKYQISEIVKNTKPDMEHIIAFCKEETIDKTGMVKIGFNR